MTTEALFENIKSKKVLVLGDVMIDAYYSGRVDRISPEAPVPIVRVEVRDVRLGGAANVAVNIKALGATPIVCAIVGDDNKGGEFIQLLADKGLTTEGILTVEDRPTTVKTRIISDNQQILRVDEEVTEDISTAEEDEILQRFTKILEDHVIDAVIFQDYNKGLLTERVIRKTMSICQSRNIFTAVDPKKENFFSYKNCSLFKPNLKEVREGLKKEFTTIDLKTLDIISNKLREKLNQQYTLLTLSELGVYYDGEERSELIAAHARDIKDVSGAGDTVISVVTLCLLAGTGIDRAAQYANLSGGLVCESVGVASIDKNKLIQESIKIGLK